MTEDANDSPAAKLLLLTGIVKLVVIGEPFVTSRIAPPAVEEANEVLLIRVGGEFVVETANAVRGRGLIFEGENGIGFTIAATDVDDVVPAAVGDVGEEGCCCCCVCAVDNLLLLLLPSDCNFLFVLLLAGIVLLFLALFEAAVIIRKELLAFSGTWKGGGGV